MTAAVGALIMRDARIALSYRLWFVLETFYGVADLALYFFISRTFEDVASTQLGAAPTYFAFAVAGVVLGAVLTATSSSIGYRIRDEQVTGTLEAVAASPVTALQLCLGLVGFPFAFALARVGLYLLIAWGALGLDVSEADWIGVALVLLATGVAIAPIGILAGAAALAIKRGNVLANTAIFLMTVLAGMAFPVAVLPGWLRWISNLIPLRYSFDGARDALFAGDGWGTDVLLLALFAALLWPLALILFRAALTFARSRATLSEF